ncbi:uncharacterized protein LOC110434492 [Sorghum bicolor]|uniref:uncharacterized protein LOC110434492 n=1 Tax=Sorghum bicolor TaxID=4558 RepID=UPI0007F236BA|nr:uncharacterized protein LOC110434492 [Sorghum bicolor]|eukprot:XP_021314304.1 uncharacterized protein LOC110434492 [Sorghum bicolor]
MRLASDPSLLGATVTTDRNVCRLLCHAFECTAAPCDCSAGSRSYACSARSPLKTVAGEQSAISSTMASNSAKIKRGRGRNAGTKYSNPVQEGNPRSITSKRIYTMARLQALKC